MYEQEAKEAKKWLDYILVEKDNHAKNNGRHEEPTGLTTPKRVPNEEPASNEKDS